ncbi:hypothetical protein TWF506_008097 [Arthrobotrys conoides]|uniref:Uncharacterized protein n=1 Tax=Arthrobotrys conoides TaxID=74498 RepID=A0AAN8NCN2_9PEZI
MSFSHSVQDQDDNAVFDYYLSDTSVPSGGEYNDEDINYHIDPNLDQYSNRPAFGKMNDESSIQSLQQEGNNLNNKLFFFSCGCCGRHGPNSTENMITFNVNELRIKEDLMICWECRIDCFPDLEKWRIRHIFKNCPWPSDFMIRVLSPRSCHDGQTGYALEGKEPKNVNAVVRWLPPSIPIVWPLWSGHSEMRPVKASNKGPGGKLTNDNLDISFEGLESKSGIGTLVEKKIYRCILCSKEEDKVSRFV